MLPSCIQVGPSVQKYLPEDLNPKIKEQLDNEMGGPQGPLLAPLLLLPLPRQHLHLPRSRRQMQAGRRVMLTRQRNSMCIRQRQRNEGNIKRKTMLLQVLHVYDYMYHMNPKPTMYHYMS